ncbi:MAG: mechanosensitive ion channel [Rhodothermales bacterium]|nr:mechanosensitive ion channel [Rhodothermales bacterium]
MLDLPESLTQALSSVFVRQLAIVVIGLIAIFLIRALINRSLRVRVDNSNARYRARKIVSMATYVVVVIYISIVFASQLGALTFMLGIAGAGIAFALQEIIMSIAGWIAISLGGYYTVGDRIQLGGITGDVVDIAILRTTLFETGAWVDGDLYNGRVVRISNSFLFKEPVLNYSGDFPFLWDEIRVPVRYGSDLALARELCSATAADLLGEFSRNARNEWKRMTNKYMIEQAIVDPLVTITADENWVTFTIRYVVDFKQRRATKDKLFTELLRRFDSSEGRVRVASAAQEITIFKGDNADG